MPHKLYVAWQDGNTRRWHTIARLSRAGSQYEFVFTKGIRGLTDIARQLFKMENGNIYRLDKLIPLFTNRIPPRNRTDYNKIASWVGVTESDDEFERLSKFGLIPGSDSMLVYPEPHIEYGVYRLKFFVHAIRHMHDDAKDWCLNAAPGTKLYPLLDVQNVADTSAVALRCESENLILGYVPTFYSRDIRTVLSTPVGAEKTSITILKNNKDAPEQLRMLCEIVMRVPPNFVSLDSDDHKPNLASNSQILAYNKFQHDLKASA